MKPSRKPAGTLPLPLDRLKARKRSQMTWVSTFQQGSVAFAAWEWAKPGGQATALRYAPLNLPSRTVALTMAT